MSPDLFSNINSSQAGTLCNIATFCKNESRVTSDPSVVGARDSTHTRHRRNQAPTTSGVFTGRSSSREGQTEGLCGSPDRLYTPEKMSVKRNRRPLHLLSHNHLSGAINGVEFHCSKGPPIFQYLYPSIYPTRTTLIDLHFMPN